MTWLIHVTDMTHIHAFTCVTWLTTRESRQCGGHGNGLLHNTLQHTATHCNTLQHNTAYTFTFTQCGGHGNGLLHIYDMIYSCVWHGSFMCVTWLIHVIDMTHLYAFTCVTWVQTMWGRWKWTTSYIRHDWFKCVTWLIYVCDMTHLYAFTCVTWLITWELTQSRGDGNGLLHIYDMTHSCVWHGSFMCVTWLTYLHPHVWHDSWLGIQTMGKTC